MIGDIIKKERGDKGMTQEQLAKILGVSASTVGMYEQNRRVPDNEMIVKLAEYFDISTDYLLGRTDLRSSATEALGGVDIFPYEFTDVKEARSYIDRHQIFGLDGFNPDVLDDDEILEFANALLEQMRMVSYKYKR